MAMSVYMHTVCTLQACYFCLLSRHLLLMLSTPCVGKECHDPSDPPPPLAMHSAGLPEPHGRDGHFGVYAYCTIQACLLLLFPPPFVFQPARAQLSHPLRLAERLFGSADTGFVPGARSRSGTEIWRNSLQSSASCGADELPEISSGDGESSVGHLSRHNAAVATGDGSRELARWDGLYFKVVSLRLAPSPPPPDLRLAGFISLPTLYYSKGSAKAPCKKTRVSTFNEPAALAPEIDNPSS